MGYKKAPIHTLYSKPHPEITKIKLTNPIKVLDLMDELGLALWMYDDGSLHKKGLFYNINTQRFSKEENESIAKVLKEKFDIVAIPTIERKKDNRVFWYLRVRKYEGAFYLSNIMRKYLPKEFHRKCISSETIQRWSKFQEELKSAGIDKDLKDFKRKQKIIRTVENSDISIQDIVRTYVKA